MSEPEQNLEAIDVRARERALDVGVSFIVQAPAGSGKTTVLTQRYLKLLASVDDPEQVLAITFTRKAAGEMRERVQQALSGRMEVRSPADALTLQLAGAARTQAAKRGWGIEESAARLRIQTIDAFNGYLAGSMPITSRNGFGRGIADDPADLYLLAAREAMRDAEADDTRRLDLERILRRLDDHWGRLERLIAGMLPRRAEWLPNLPQLSGEELVPRIEASLRTIVREELEEAAAALPASFVELASLLARFACQHVHEQHAQLSCWRNATLALTTGLEDLARWRAVSFLALTDGGTPRARLTKSEGLPADDPTAKMLKDSWSELLERLDPRQLTALKVLRLLPDPVIPDDARSALDSLARLLVHAAVHLKAAFDQHGECDHTEIAGAARQALTQENAPTPLAERLGTHLRHILVDEFQDTSRDQYELLLTLTWDWTSGDGRTVFLVGDPMQSIYGFRNAEVGRFATVRAAGLGGLPLESLTLRRNFRSAPALVHWCNETFARVFPAAVDVRRSAIPHLPSVAGRTQLQGEPRLYRVAGPCGPQAEAEEVGRLIAELRKSRPTESIAVLAGARPHLRAVRASLHTRGIPFIGVNLEPLADVPAVRDVEALARALESPLDRVAWLAVLRAPFVGLTLADLTLVSEAAGEGTGVGTVPAALLSAIPGLSPDGALRLMRARPILLAAWHGRERENRAHLVERTWLALGGASACVRDAELGHVQRFLAELDLQDRKRLRGRPLDLQAMMGRVFAEDVAQPGAVSLMTIHGAKGLEFDHVLVVGVGRRGRGDEARLLNWLEMPREREGDHLVMAPIRHRAEDEDDDDINRYLKHLHQERSRAERTRQAYVALTRARRTLHLFVHPATQQGGDVHFRAGANTLLENLWPAVSPHLKTMPIVGEEQDPAEPVPVISQTRRRVPSRLTENPPLPDVLARGDIVPVGPEEEPIEFSWARQTARRVGTVVHETLERFGRSALPSLGDLPGWRPRLVSRLEALGVEGDAAREGAERAMRALAATLTDERGRWLFDASHSQAHSELALSGVRGDAVVNVVIDRTFVDETGVRWVVDFKTSPHEGGDREAFLDEEVRRYQPQLRRYALLARRLGPEPVRAGLYYPLLGAWREVDVDASPG